MSKCGIQLEFSPFSDKEDCLYYLPNIGYGVEDYSYFGSNTSGLRACYEEMGTEYFLKEIFDGNEKYLEDAIKEREHSGLVNDYWPYIEVPLIIEYEWTTHYYEEGTEQDCEYYIKEILDL